MRQKEQSWADAFFVVLGQIVVTSACITLVACCLSVAVLALRWAGLVP